MLKLRNSEEEEEEKTGGKGGAGQCALFEVRRTVVKGNPKGHSVLSGNQISARGYV